jgi:hypothetical protein
VVDPETLDEHNLPKHFGHVTFEAQHFSEGACRRAFRGLLHAPGDNGVVQDGHRWSSWKRAVDTKTYPCVVKVFKKNYHPKACDAWRTDVDVLKLAEKLALEFNRQSKANKEIHFAMPLLAKMERVAAERFLFWEYQESDLQKLEWVCVEPFLDGKFVKFLSNTGWVNQDVEAKLAHAFSHWTWHTSNGSCLVCDMQGIRFCDGYLLTDPACHTLQHTMGVTDLGQAGMESFFRTHVCNEFCKTYSRPQMIREGNRWKPRRGTTFTWQVEGHGLQQPFTPAATPSRSRSKESLSRLNTPRYRLSELFKRVGELCCPDSEEIEGRRAHTQFFV